MKKRIISIILMLVLGVINCSIYSSAEDIQGSQSYIDERYIVNSLTVNIHIEDALNFVPGNMVFGIYSPSKQFWGAQKIWAADIAGDHELLFEVPDYYIGQTMYLTLYSGAEKIIYADKEYAPEELIPIETYSYVDENGELIKVNSTYISAVPKSSPYINTYANGYELYFKNPAKLINGVCMIPLFEYLEALEMQDYADVNYLSGKIAIEANDHLVLFFLNGEDMYADGEVTYSKATPVKANGVIYVPFRFLVEGLGGSVNAYYDEAGKLNADASLRLIPPKKSEVLVNEREIKSKTDYLVWVAKKDYTVTVFLKKGDKWKEIRVFPCSIGAPSTPTITGQFEYYSKEKRWSYDTYYVGPIMRFYNGYALHSTLIRYDGSPADARLGKQISHGCVRLKPEDIQWMVDYVPLYTKIYITNEGLN